MTNDTNDDANLWPLPKFYFSVDIGDGLMGIPFQEVSGMDIETQVIEYRSGNSPVFSTIKMPGIVKYGNVTMKRGLFVKDTNFWNWYQESVMNTVKRREVRIQLRDETGAVAMQWTLQNAFPTKISSTDMESDGNEVAVDSIEFAHEGLTIS